MRFPAKLFEKILQLRHGNAEKALSPATMKFPLAGRIPSMVVEIFTICRSPHGGDFKLMCRKLAGRRCGSVTGI